MTEGQKILYVDTYGSMLGVKEGRIQLRRRVGGKWRVITDVSPLEIESIVIAVEGVSITGAVFRVAAEYSIDINFIFRNEPATKLIPATYGSAMNTWVKQLYAALRRDSRAKLAKKFVEGKLNNQRMVLYSFWKTGKSAGNPDPKLRKIIERIKEWEGELPKAQTWRDAGKIESKAARLYWMGVRRLIPRELGFRKRLKKWDLQPFETPDPFNAALNVGYALLKKEVWKAVFIANLNPYIGFLHARRPGRMSLVFDLMEEFRPIAIDRPLIKLARKSPKTLKPLQQKDTEESRTAVKTLWKYLREEMGKTKPPTSQLIQKQARKLARHLLLGEEYKPHKTKW